MSYAEGTEVPVSRTRGHIEELLAQHHADSVGIITESSPPRATVAFRIQGWGVRMRIAVPPPESFATAKVRGRDRKTTPEQRQRLAEQAARERWRALFLTLKAKLVSVETGVETFEEAFLPHLVLTGGTTVMDRVRGELKPGMTEFPQLGSGK